MDRFYVISNSMKDPEGKIAKEIKAYLNFRGKQCIIQERQGKESLRSYKYTNANLIPDDTECILVVGGDGTLLQAARDMIERNIPESIKGHSAIWQRWTVTIWKRHWTG